MTGKASGKLGTRAEEIPLRQKTSILLGLYTAVAGAMRESSDLWRELEGIYVNMQTSVFHLPQWNWCQGFQLSGKQPCSMLSRQGANENVFPFQ